MSVVRVTRLLALALCLALGFQAPSSGPASAAELLTPAGNIASPTSVWPALWAMKATSVGSDLLNLAAAGGYSVAVDNLPPPWNSYTQYSAHRVVLASSVASETPQVIATNLAYEFTVLADFDRDGRVQSLQQCFAREEHGYQAAARVWLALYPGGAGPGNTSAERSNDDIVRLVSDPIALDRRVSGDPNYQLYCDSLLKNSDGLLVPEKLAQAQALLSRWDQAHGTRYIRNLVDNHVGVWFTNLPSNIYGLYAVEHDVILLSGALVDERVELLADVLAHETSHALDAHNGVVARSGRECLDSEFRAFKHQAEVWQSFFPGGLKQPSTAAERQMNEILARVTADPQSFARELAGPYRHECP